MPGTPSLMNAFHQQVPVDEVTCNPLRSVAAALEGVICIYKNK